MGHIFRRARTLFKQNALFIVGATSVLWLSFSFNIFGAMSNDAFMANFKDSESLTVSAVTCEGRYFDGQLMFNNLAGTDRKYECDLTQLTPYSSQFGLQGRLYTGGYIVLHSLFGMPVAYYIFFAQLVTALLSALCFAVFAVWVRKRYGMVSAVVVIIGTALAPMVVGFARNLYWALPLMVAPFLYVLMFYKSMHAKQLHPVIFWGGLFVLLYLRLLCGYEYVTSFAIAVFAGMVPYLYESKSRVLTYGKQALITICIALLAFGAALTTHVVSLAHSTGSIFSAMNIVKTRALERTVKGSEYTQYAIQGLKTNMPVVYSIANSYVHLDEKQQSMKWAIVASALNYLFMPIVLIPLQFTQPVGVFAQSFIVNVLLLTIIFVYRKRLFEKKRLQTIEGLSLGALVGLGAYMSWLVLASSHSLVHAHINGILMYLPYALFAFTIMGITLQTVITRLRVPYAKKKQ